MILAYYYAFMVVSLAILGLGIDGLYVHYRQGVKTLGTAGQNNRILVVLAPVYAITATLSILVITKLPIMTWSNVIYFLLCDMAVATRSLSENALLPKLFVIL